MAAFDELNGVLVDASRLDEAAALADAPTGPGAALVGARAVRDTDLPRVQDPALPVAVLVTGGAGQIAGPAGFCRGRELPVHSLTVALWDLDDLPGNARRVVTAVGAARADGALADDTTIRVALPPEPAGHRWLAAADELAAAELQLSLPLGAGDVPVPADLLAGWIDAALDRETPYGATGGGPAVCTPAGHGVLNLLAASAAAWDRASAAEVVAALENTEPPLDALATGRRWCRAVEVPDAAATADELVTALNH